MRRTSRSILIVCLVLVSTAWARDWRISHFDTQMSVAQDGTAIVNERIDLVFIGSYQGIYRDIPIEYPGPHGTNYTLFLKVISVTDANGDKLKYDSSVEHGNRHLKIYIPGAEDTGRTVQINYIVRNPVRWFDDYDELYWNVTGNDWPVPIDSASATVNFPGNAAGNLRAQAFTGIYGAKERDADVKLRGSTVLIESERALSMREGLTADVYINKGVLTQPGKWTQAAWFLRSNPIVFLPPWAFVVMFFLWWTKGRDPSPGISVAPMYEPPKGMTPAEAGTLLDDAVHPRDITSTLVDLAVKGYLKIEEKESKTLVFTHRDYIFHLLKPRSEWTSLEPHERVMLSHMFPEGVSDLHLSDLRNQFYVALPTMKDNILSELKEKGMYSVDPESAHAYVLAGLLFTAAPFILGQVLGTVSVLESTALLVASSIIALLIVFLFARIMTAKSIQGARTKVEILGFQEFMNRVDADRLKRLPPDTFEKFLPYAMAFGIEHRWAKAFQGIAQNPPNWYVGPTPYTAFNPIFFAGSMHALATDAHQAFVAAPRASSTGSGWGGGSGGGGFSGGGFGGGGGGAF